MRTTALVLATTFALLGACANEPVPDAAPVDGPAAEEVATTDHEAKKEEHAAMGGEQEESCGATTELTNDVQTRRVDDQGREVLHVGKDFTDATEVTVSQLLASPADFEGKIVRVKGPISAMCTHERAWFAVAAEDQSGQQLRLMTAPTFLVPEGSIGKDAVAEGTVELITMSGEHAAHMAEEHKLGEGENFSGPVTSVVIRASGADFI